MSWFVYIVECRDGSYYTGITRDILKRLNAHNSGKGAKYTASRKPVTLVSHRSVETRSEALKLEMKVKKQSRSKKLKTLKG